ncbi:MAG: hypothetical protein DCC57_00015 [Chloroflexi bacterium]|nr:MAG: hypothetical protein DCC57_00015 [Chloroflexota bacterium]
MATEPTAIEPTATEDDKTPQAEQPPAPGAAPAIDRPGGNVAEKVDTAGVDAASVDTAVVQCANLFLNVRRLLLMSLGALALTADEARDFVERLGERGDMTPGVTPELAQEELERWVDDLHHQHPALAMDGDSARGSRVDALWGRLRVPTRREIEALSRKINALDQRLAALRATRSAAPSAGAASPPAPGPATPPEPGAR